MCNCHSILECCVMLSGVKLSMGSFVSLLLWQTCMEIGVKLFSEDCPIRSLSTKYDTLC